MLPYLNIVQSQTRLEHKDKWSHISKGCHKVKKKDFMSKYFDVL